MPPAPAGARAWGRPHAPRARPGTYLARAGRRRPTPAAGPHRRAQAGRGWGRAACAVLPRTAHRARPCCRCLRPARPKAIPGSVPHAQPPQYWRTSAARAPTRCLRRLQRLREPGVAPLLLSGVHGLRVSMVGDPIMDGKRAGGLRCAAQRCCPGRDEKEGRHD